MRMNVPRRPTAFGPRRFMGSSLFEDSLGGDFGMRPEIECGSERVVVVRRPFHLAARRGETLVLAREEVVFSKAGAFHLATESPITIPERGSAGATHSA